MDAKIKRKKLVTSGRIAAAAVVIAAVCLGFYATRGHPCEGPPEISPPKVTVQQPQWVENVDYVTQTGTLVAYNSVDLVARVEGYLDSIEFTDGTFVKKGQ